MADEPASSPPPPPTSSYIYPVRTLLTGGIQPASQANTASSPTSGPTPEPSTSTDLTSPSTSSAQSQPPQKAARKLKKSLDLGNRFSRDGLGPSSPQFQRRSQRSRKYKSDASSAGSGSNAGTPLSPAIRHHPGDDDSYFPRSLVTPKSAAAPTLSTATDDMLSSAPAQEVTVPPPVTIYSIPEVASPENIDEGTKETADTLASVPQGDLQEVQVNPQEAEASAQEAQASTRPELDLSHPFDLSKYGLVHLPPSAPGSVGGRSNTSRSSGSGQQSRSHVRSTRLGKQKEMTTFDEEPRRSSDDINAANLKTLDESLEQILPRDPSEASLGEPSASSRPMPEPHFHASTNSNSVGRLSSSENNVSTSASEDPDDSGVDEPLITFRYQHIEDENGHHVAVGREGQLTRCEDEPIRTPGAVQGFGVLIVIDEDTENNTLVVRQVSENSYDILGLSPKYLFGLECFTDTLPEAQADILWDNIQFLDEPEDAENSTSEQDYSPHVFQLTGYGEPGSTALGDSISENNQRLWNCWCAVHRPQQHGPNGPGSSTSGAPGLLILEFELERDTLNPLYPPFIDGVDGGSSSPASSHSANAMGSKGSTDGSDKTLVAGGNSDSTSTPTVGESTPQADASNTIATRESMTVAGLEGVDSWVPSAGDIFESTTSRSKPILALERLRRMTRAANSPSTATIGGAGRRRGRRQTASSHGVGMMDVFAVMAQINEQLGAATELENFLQIVAGVIKDLTQFHRVLVYQFDESYNGQVVAELLDWSRSHDLYQGLHFPASDIPAQARELYAINKVRLLYDRAQTTARLIARGKEDLRQPLNMTHCYLRAMSPIHIKYLENMGVRSSMSVSIMAFGALWGLVTCHSYGSQGMRVSFPVRQMLRLLSQSISRNIERLSYARRLHTRKLINTMASETHPTGHIVSNADDLLSLFDADYGILVIGEAAKILGPNEHGQEILIMAEYLRLKRFDAIQVSQAVTHDFSDLRLSNGLEVIAGLLYVPLSTGGQDFIAFLRKGQPREVHWAGKPHRDGNELKAKLEPRKSFRLWSEKVAGRCRAWTDEQLETAGVLALVYGKFIEVWRQKEFALETTKLTNLLLSNASHEVRTPLNHIINYLEMALNGPLDSETRDNLSRSHEASKSLLFTINDLLDLTRLESGKETSFNEPFDLPLAIEDAIHLYRKEADRRGLQFKLEFSTSPKMVIGDGKKIRTVVSNLTANALKFTDHGEIIVSCQTFNEPAGLRDPRHTAVEIVVADTGCGIAPEKLESIFREFEQVESSERNNKESGVGLGLAVVARIVEQLGGQLRVDSKVAEGSRFSLLIPLALDMGPDFSGSSASSLRSSLVPRSRNSSARSPIESKRGSRSGSEIDSLVEAISSSHMDRQSPLPSPGSPTRRGQVDVVDSGIPLRPIKIDEYEKDKPRTSGSSTTFNKKIFKVPSKTDLNHPKLRILIVEDNEINRVILGKRLTLDGHTVVHTTNGQEGLDLIKRDQDFDCVLMDIQMPILNGFEATECIRAFEHDVGSEATGNKRLSHALNGRIPIFAVSASLVESQHEDMANKGIDGWILKPIDVKRLKVILQGVTNPRQRERDLYRPGCSWEAGGWLVEPVSDDRIPIMTPSEYQDKGKERPNLP